MSNGNDKFWERVDRRGPNDCWEWKDGRTVRGGYGQLRIGGRSGRVVRAHRRAYELANSVELSPSSLVCHRCDNPPCCNPAHLFVGTNADNNADARMKGRARVPTSPRDERHHSSKLTVSDVREIRASTESLGVLADRFGVSKAAVSHVRNKKVWKHVA